jgi:hypothetical protein
MPARTLSPLFSLHLLFCDAEFENKCLGKFHQGVRAASVKNGIGQIANMMLDPGCINAPAAARPIVLRLGTGAGYVEFEMRILFFQLAKFSVENDVLGLAYAVKDGDFGVQFPARSFANESTEWRHAGASGHTNQMLVINGQKFSDRRDDKELIALLGPIHDARAHLAVAFDGDFVEAAIEGAGRKRISAFVIGRIRPINRDELAGLELGIMTVGPFKANSLGIGQFHHCRFDGHLENFFGHKNFSAWNLVKTEIHGKRYKYVTDTTAGNISFL